jgi:predicted RNase H-like nuclease (RuvC/YqgF family)
MAGEEAETTTGGYTMTATARKPREKKEPTEEQKLRSEISALDRKIEAQRVHINNLQAELSKKQSERNALVKQRIELLQKELPDEQPAEQ